MLRKILFATVLLTGCTTMDSIVPQKPKVALKNLTMGKISLTEVQLNAALTVMNPNAYALNLAGIDYQVDAVGLTLGKGSTTEAISLAPGMTQTVNLPLTLTTSSAYKFGQAYMSNTKQLPVNLKATVRVNTPVGPLSLNFEDVKDLKAK